MRIYLLMGAYYDKDLVEVIIAAFDSREKAERAMIFYDESEYSEMWVKEMLVQ